MNLKYLLIFCIFYSCKFTGSNERQPPCFPDKGIKKAVVTATMQSDETKSAIQTIHYDTLGRPLLREENNERSTTFLYNQKDLKGTIVNMLGSIIDSTTMEMEIISSDTNLVTKNDEYGRALEMGGGDGILKHQYEGCEVELQIYTDNFGKPRHEFKLIHENGILMKTIWSLPGDKKGRETIYYDYEFNESNHWVKRIYEFPSGDKIVEERILELYE